MSATPDSLHEVFSGLKPGLCLLSCKTKPKTCTKIKNSLRAEKISPNTTEQRESLLFEARKASPREALFRLQL